MKKPLAVAGVVLALLVAATASAQDAKPNFSGTWNMDAAKSDFGPMPPPDTLVIVVDHKEPMIKITTTQKSAMGDVSNERTLSTDGKETLNKLRTPVGDTDLKSTSSWDGRKLVTSSHMDLMNETVSYRDVWELSGDGKVLTTVRAGTTTQGDFATKIIFNKQ